MNKDSNAYTFGFALVICLVCSLMVSSLAQGLKPAQDLNKEIDRKTNVLKSLGLPEDSTKVYTKDEIQKVYSEKVLEVVLDPKGKVIKDLKPEQVKESDSGKFPVFVRKDGKESVAYAIPTSGKGLWSTIRGYIALTPDGNTVKGITFYEHGETPGLGGECEKDWFTSNWAGKKTRDKSGKLVSITVVKGQVDKVVSDPEQKTHSVDGISGATITSRGISDFVKTDLKNYEIFFTNVGQGKGGI